MSKLGFIYIVTNRRNVTLYTGVTSNLVTRIEQHKCGFYNGFSKRYRTHQLVWFDCCNNIKEAIVFEKMIKRRSRSWKIKLIESLNPRWRDLSEEWR